MATVLPDANDVLLGRGTIINNHPGNRQFRSLVDAHKQSFGKAKTKKEKRMIASQIFSQIKSLQPPGRFLAVDPGQIVRTDDSNDSFLLTQTWSGVEPRKALLKIMHRLRESEKEEQKEKACSREESTSIMDRGLRTFNNQFTSAAQSDSVANDALFSTEYHSYRDHNYGFSITNNESEVIQVQCAYQSSSTSEFRPNSCLLEPRISTSQHIDLHTKKNRNKNDTTAEGQSRRDTDLFKYLQSNDVNFELDSLLLCPTPEADLNSSQQQQQLQEYTLQQWIGMTLQDFNPKTATTVQLSTAKAIYMKLALVIAVKLIECILEADKDELKGLKNPIPLASIAPENVVLGTKCGQSDGEKVDAVVIIEYVWVMSIIGDGSAAGDVMARLHAAGKVLYYLFSMGVSIEDDTASQNVSMNSITFSSEGDGDNVQAQKKPFWRSTQADDEMSNYVARLEAIGIPWSVCDLVKNLLECKNGSFCKDDAYGSFDDLQVDLRLMVENPSCFLDNIQITHPQKMMVQDKLYGREKEVLKLEELYQSHVNSGKFNGCIISGGAGVGKSKLALHMQTVTSHTNGYFLSAKFEHNQMSLKPLSNITNMFDSLCEMLSNDSTEPELKVIEEQLIRALGSQSNLLGFVPNLKKLMPSSQRHGTAASLCVDSALSMRYLFGELFRVISSQKPITIVLDDTQFADETSLILLGSLLHSSQRQDAPIFFCLCHRDNEANMSESFNAWLTTITMFSFESIKLESISPDAVNNLLSEALHLSPRLTRPLSSALYHKTRGNPLFLRQLLDSLIEEGFIYIDLNRHCWAWDLGNIMNLDISESVLALLISEVRKLPSDLQLGLQVASCIGSCVNKSMIDYLSQEISLDLADVLRRVSERGLMINVSGSMMFRFAHDKIQEAAYNMIPEQQRRENHMRFGLALCTQSFDNAIEDDDLFFAAVNQINQGGPAAVHESGHMSIIAELNLKAGRRSIELSDYITAFMLFQHGISFLGDNHWTLSYKLSLDLYQAVAEVALILNKLSCVKMYTGVAVTHAQCFDDKLHCLIVCVKAIGAHRPDESIDSAFGVLLQLGECLPRSMVDESLKTDIDKMKYTLLTKTDYELCNMHKNTDKKLAALINLYVYLAHVLHYFKPWLVGAISLRMVELTLNIGLSAQSPLVFAHFGGVLVTSGCISEGCRLGKLAVKMVEQKGSQQLKSSVLCIVYDRILFTSEPFQLIAGAHLLGFKFGQQSGDYLYALTNQVLAIKTHYAVGNNLCNVQADIMDFLSVLQGHGLKIFANFPTFLLSQIMVLKNGLHMSVLSHVDNLPSEGQILASARSGSNVLLYGKIHFLSRAFLFRQLDDASHNIDISGKLAKDWHQLNLFHLMGFFFEGLASFLLARQSSSKKSAECIKRGQSVLTKMRCWSGHSQWNWENKVLLLEAESMYTNKEFNKAGPLYDRAIRSAREHNFIHEEAIASELAGTFYFMGGFRHKSLSFLLHSIDCYEKWGAHAVAKRVQTDIRDYFGSEIDQLKSSADASLECIFTLGGNEKKRQHSK